MIVSLSDRFYWEKKKIHLFSVISDIWQYLYFQSSQTGCCLCWPMTPPSEPQLWSASTIPSLRMWRSRHQSLAFTSVKQFEYFSEASWRRTQTGHILLSDKFEQNLEIYVTYHHPQFSLIFKQNIQHFNFNKT